MKKKDQLYELIQSMSKAEKRHFKLYSSFQSGSKNYVELFSMLDKQVAYNEDKVRKRFAGEKFLEQLHVTKNYLYNLILRSLESLHQKKTVKAQVPSLVNRIEILSERELYSQARKLLNKALKLASQQELLSDQLKLQELKAKIDLNLLSPAKYKDAQLEDEAKIKNILRKISAQFKIATQDHSGFGSPISADSAPEPEVSENYHGQLQDFQMKIQEHHQLQQFDLAVEEAGTCLEFMESHAEKLDGQLGVYEKVSRNQIKNALLAKMAPAAIFQRLQSYLQTHDRLKIRGQELIKRRLEQHYVLLFFEFLHQLENASDFRERVEAIVEQWDRKRTEVLSTPKETVANLLSSYYFKINEFHHCLVHTDQWVESFKKKIPSLSQAAIRCRYMLCGFEMDRWDLIEKRLNDLDDLKSTEQTQFKAEVSLRSFFKILNKVSNQTQKNNMFILLKAELMGLLQNNEKEQKVFEHFDLLDWIDRRDNRRTFSEKLRDFSA